MDPRVELRGFAEKLSRREPFVFVRFSDGETEILKGHKLELGASGVTWSRGESAFVYPEYDHKSFDPLADAALREALIESAKYRSPRYFKGIPTRHNRDKAATRLMYELNGESWKNLTFSDLWINSNFKFFLKEIVDDLLQRKVTLLANYRTNPKLLSANWDLIPVPDAAFQIHESLKRDAMAQISQLPPGSVVLSSASSLSNLIGHDVSMRNLEICFLDVGTALHPLLGFDDSRRLYLSQLKPWTRETFREKIAYAMSRGSLRW